MLKGIGEGGRSWVSLQIMKQQCVQLIELYGMYKMLWDSTDPNYTHIDLKKNEWSRIGGEINDSLLSSYRCEKS